MRTVNCLLLLFLIGTLYAHDSEFASANRKYEEGQYAAAQKIYTELVAAGVRSSHLFYNLGNAEFRLGNRGAAALNYERALVLEPAHAEARANLKLVRTQSGAQLFQNSWLHSLYGLFSNNALWVMGAVAFWGSLFALCIGLLKGWRRATLLVLASGLTLLLYAGVGGWLSAQSRGDLLVVAEADARFAPADRAALVARLPVASQLRLLADRGSWVYCLLADGRRAWLPAATVEPIVLKH